MATDEAYVFEGISREAFEMLKSDLRHMGISVPECDSCTLSHRGVKATLEYSEDDGRVSVRVISKPLFVPASTVRTLLTKAMSRYTNDGAA